MTSERGFMERIFQDIAEMKKEQSIMKSDISEIKTNMTWVMHSLEDMSSKFSGCRVCASPEEIMESHTKLKKLVYDLRDSFNQIKWTSGGISAGITLIILIIAFLYKLNST